MEPFLLEVWTEVMQQPTDSLPDLYPSAIADLREVHFTAAWYVAFDILEILYDNLPANVSREGFTAAVNNSLQSASVGYRLIDGLLVPIVNTTEVDAIDRALQAAPSPARQHLRRSLELLSDRKNPDYRNSMKESISAVETVARQVAGQKGGFGALVATLDVHPQVARGFSNLYNYTSDEDGIRHAMMDMPRVDATDALYLLVVCSAFVTYVTARGLLPRD